MICPFPIDKALKETLDKVLLSGYFDRAQTHQNGACEEEEQEEEEEEEEEQQQSVVHESSGSREQPAEPGNRHSHNFLWEKYVCRPR